MGGRQIIVLDPFVSEAFSAAAPAEIAVAWVWDAAYVSRTVTSHSKGFPRDQGTNVAPSGLLPSFLDNPIGFLLAGICAFLIARQIRSLSWEWRMWRGALLRHARLCRPLASTIVPQTHMCGWHIIVPRRKPVATRMASSDNRRPTAVRGGACSQSPACGVVKAFNRAWSTGSAHLARISL